VSRPFFFTGRRELKQSDLLISIWDDHSGTPMMKVDLRLGDYAFPDDAEVSVDAYSTIYYQRFSVGCVADVRDPVIKRLDDLSRGDRPLCRVKVIEKQSGRLLAARDRVSPATLGSTHTSRRSILDVEWKSNDEMQGELWWVNRVDKVLFLNQDVPGLHLQAQQHDPRFEAFVYPAALRELLCIAFLEEEDGPDRDSDWYHFAVGLLGDDAPEREPTDDDDRYRDQLLEWIDRVVKRFCKKQQYFQRLKELEGSFASQGETT
jgi:hypothetical protein